MIEKLKVESFIAVVTNCGQLKYSKKKIKN